MRAVQPKFDSVVRAFAAQRASHRGLDDRAVGGERGGCQRDEGAAEAALPGHMPSLVTGIAPAVKAVSQQAGGTLANAIRQNVIDNVARLSSATPILSAAVEQGKLKVVGGIYRLRDGRVEMVG